MVSLRLHFKGLLKNLQPPPERVEAARTLPKPVQEFLRLHREFVTLSPTPGSPAPTPRISRSAT